MQGRHGYIGTGEFGGAVGRMLGHGTDLSAVTASPADPSEIAARFSAAAVDVIVAVLWRPSPRLCELIENAAGLAEVAWVPAVLCFPYITVGPVIRPGHGPCFRCITRRQAQHSAPELPEEGLLAAYDADPECGPAGHLDCHARVTAGLIGWLLRDLTRPPGNTSTGDTGPYDTSLGNLVRFQMVNRSIHTVAVWPWHDCASCGARPQPDPAFRLRAALAGPPPGGTG